MPPKWILTPNDTEAIVGQNVVIDCTAAGNPTPRIWWEMALGLSDISSSANAYRTVISNSHIHILENGSLSIREVTESDQGLYLCKAANGIGSGLSKVVKLTVHGTLLSFSSVLFCTLRALTPESDNRQMNCRSMPFNAIRARR